MFMGEYSHTIDAKGRLIIPAKLREQLGSRAILTKGFDQCLSIFTEERWKYITTALNKQPSTKAGIRVLQRMLFGSATEIEFDSQGRILVPPSLRRAAELEKKCIVVGVGEHIEVWSEARWNNYVEEVSPSVESLVEDLEDIVF
mgnify:CR=1 FL=1